MDIYEQCEKFNEIHGVDINVRELYFRRDIDDCDPKEQWDFYIFAKEELAEFNLELIDPLVEHDCISGGIRLSMTTPK